jgi:hypothetical protein
VKDQEDQGEAHGHGQERVVAVQGGHPEPDEPGQGEAQQEAHQELLKEDAPASL